MKDEGEREKRRSTNKMESEIAGRSRNEVNELLTLVLFSHRMEMETMIQDTIKGHKNKPLTIVRKCT